MKEKREEVREREKEEEREERREKEERKRIIERSTAAAWVEWCSVGACVEA